MSNNHNKWTKPPQRTYATITKENPDIAKQALTILQHEYFQQQLRNTAIQTESQLADFYKGFMACLHLPDPSDLRKMLKEEQKAGRVAIEPQVMQTTIDLLNWSRKHNGPENIRDLVVFVPKA